MEEASLIIGSIGVLVSSGAWIWAARAAKSAKETAGAVDELKSELHRIPKPAVWAVEWEHVLTDNGGTTEKLALRNAGVGVAYMVTIKAENLDIYLGGDLSAEELHPGKSIYFNETPTYEGSSAEILVSWYDETAIERSQILPLPVRRPYL